MTQCYSQVTLAPLSRFIKGKYRCDHQTNPGLVFVCLISIDTYLYRMGDLNLEQQTKPTTPVWRVLKRMMSTLLRPEMKRWRGRIVLALLLTFVAKAFSVSAPVFLGEGLNRAADVAKAAGNAEAAGYIALQDAPSGFGPFEAVGAPFLWFVFLFGAARFFANGLPQARDAFFTRVTQDAQRLVAVEAFAHAQKQSLQFHLTRRAGALSRVIERGASSIEFLLRFVAFNIGPTLIELALAAVVMAALYSVPIAIISVFTVFAFAAVTILITEWRSSLRRAVNEADTKLRAISTDTLTNFETVKSFVAESRETGRYDGAVQIFAKKYVRSMQSLHLLNASQEFIMTTGLLAAVIFGALAVSQGDMKVGDVTAIVLMLSNIYRPLMILGFAWREIRQGTVDIEKLHDLLDLKPGVEDANDARELTRIDGPISFENVYFAHEGRESGLKGVRFDIPSGAYVALVGPSGAGKSTVLKLLLRFFDPTRGAIKIDGQDIRKFKQASLRKAFGIVPQDVALFNDTLRFNLTYAKPDASDDELTQALKAAQLTEFVGSLPMGLDTLVGERGLKLSGGERQRVGLARAILSNPMVLILDEATSSLDSQTERDVQSALNEASRGRTTLAVAHRLSTIAHADFILVMNNGEIIERGTHKQLLEKGGLYAELWQRQITDAFGDHPNRGAKIEEKATQSVSMG
ncbi:MAG: ABC transporter ATP-binding protein/permease [Pseudomonadota bacterium]